MSDTPRTDALVNTLCRSGVDWHYSGKVMAEHARTLERELAMAQAQLATALQLTTAASIQHMQSK